MNFINHLLFLFEMAGVEVFPVDFVGSVRTCVLGLADLLLYVFFNFMFKKLSVVEIVSLNY